MKKYLLFLLAFIPVLMFNSCSSDDDNPTVNSQILGTWVNTNDIEVVVTTFNSNGTVTETVSYTHLTLPTNREV